MNRRTPLLGAAVLAAAALVGAALVPGSAMAQQTGSASGQTQVEVRGGLTVGSHSGSAAALDIAPALSYDVVVKRQMTSTISAFGGFFRTAFGCEEGFCKDREITVVGNHVAAGAEWRSGTPWLRAGLLFGTTEAGIDGDAPKAGVGVYGAAGLSIGSGRFRFLPGASYRWLSAGTESSSDHAVALALDLGFGFQIGGGGS